ncbi:hypothetical protein Vi05172_g11279 [Venturia inaequalis]|nr:hypothetical protein Vi05172_g11279 [Venturia inaequalis]
MVQIQALASDTRMEDLEIDPYDRRTTSDSKIRNQLPN